MPKKLFIDQRKNLPLLAGALASAALFLLVVSKNSPLYPLNDWVDVNCFMTMGRGILNGKVPYKDLYEQKGPVLYFWYALISLFPGNAYLGNWLAEILLFGLFLFFGAKTAALYLKNSFSPWLTMIVCGFLVLAAPSVEHGGGVEEMHLVFLTASLYYFLRARCEKRFPLPREAFIFGFSMAVAFWSKYTFCGFYAGLAFAVLLTCLIHRPLYDGAAALFHYILYALLGFLAITLPLLVYFALNGALGDLFEVYFYNNIFLYARTEHSIWKYMKDGLYLTFKRNLIYSVLWIPGGLYCLWGFIRKRWQESLALILCFFGLVATTYMSSPGYIYYGLILSPFVLSGLIAVQRPFDGLLNKLFTKGPGFFRTPWPGLAFSLMLSLGLALFVAQICPNVYAMKWKYEETPQAIFAAQITEEDATIYNYRFLDAGFYYAAGIEPVNRFFCRFNIKLPEMDAEEEKLVSTGYFDYVVCRTNKLPSRLVKSGGYELIAEAERPYSNPDKMYYYYLYRKQR